MGGLRIKNVRNAKISLMGKTIFMLLNSEDKIWVHIFNLKYGAFHNWNGKIIKNASSFYQTLYSFASKIKSNC